MTMNIQEPRPTDRPEQPVGIEPTPKRTPVANPTGVSGVAVYDRGSDQAADPSMRPSASMLDEVAPGGTQSSGSMVAWILGIVVLIIIAYFILQMLF